MPPCGHLDLAVGDLDRAGEGAVLVAEQLGFEQVLRDGGAVDGDELALAAARLVDRAGQQFLAGAARAQQHHRHIGVGDTLDGARDLEHFGRGADDRAEHLPAAGLLRAAGSRPRSRATWKARRTIRPSSSISTGLW